MIYIYLNVPDKLKLKIGGNLKKTRRIPSLIRLCKFKDLNLSLF